MRAAYFTLLSVFCGFVLSACGDHSPTTPSGATPCSYSVRLTTSSFAAGGGTGTASVTAGAGCSWSATSGADWVTLSGASQGSGPGSFTYTVAASSAANDRQTTIGVASASATISQTACAITVAPSAITVGNGSEQASVAVTASGACSWNASADASWLSADPGTGHGSSALTLHVAENNTTGARTAHVQVGGATITVSQAAESAGCAFTFSPAAAELEHHAGTGSVDVRTAASCEYTLDSSEPWLHLAAIGSHRGSARIDYSYDAYPAGSWTDTRRAALFVIGGGPGERSTIEQFPDCHVVVSSIAEFAAAGGTVTVDVLADPAFGCPWRAKSGASWLTVGAGTPGRGDGAFQLTASPNGTGVGRSATIEVSGTTIAVSQSAH